MIDGNEGKRMKILVITGSPHQKGTTAVLAEQFIKGAEEAGHDIFRFDAAFHDIHPCIACERCHTTDKGCTFQDDMQELNPKLLEAEAVVFVSPVYYYAINAQIKAFMQMMQLFTRRKRQFLCLLWQILPWNPRMEQLYHLREWHSFLDGILQESLSA